MEHSWQARAIPAAWPHINSWLMWGVTLCAQALDLGGGGGQSELASPPCPGVQNQL